jgi:NAD(P)H-flavin reductase
MLPSFFRIRKQQSETVDTVTFTLEAPPNADVPSFLPGQFNMMYVFGQGEAAISISGDPGERGTLIHTVRAVGSVTRGMMGLGKGDQVGIRGPFGTAWPVEEAAGHDLVIVAGGIGLAALRPVIYHVIRHRDQYARVTLLYGARTLADLLYERELSSWRSRFDLEVGVTVDAGTSAWRGNVGVVTSLMARAHFEPDDAIVFICGPEIMMRFAVLELNHLGIDERQMYISMERNMHCGIGLCGHCQYGPLFVCRDGPVFRYDQVGPYLGIREL